MRPEGLLLRKIIFIETWWRTKNSTILVIVEVFKIVRHYLKDYMYEILILTDYNNLYYFMDTKSLCFK